MPATALLECLDSVATDFILLGDIENDTNHAPAFAASNFAVSVDDLPAGLRAGTALVAVPAEGDVAELLPLMARLRDVHAGQVLVHLPAARGASAATDRAELLAMGFEARKSPSGDGLVFAWDPDLANRPREWNNSRFWANPENFSRYRW